MTVRMCIGTVSVILSSENTDESRARCEGFTARCVCIPGTEHGATLDGA